MEWIKLRGRSSSYEESVLEKEERRRKGEKKEEKENHKEGEREEEVFPPLFSDLGGSRTSPTHFNR